MTLFFFYISLQNLTRSQRIFQVSVLISKIFGNLGSYIDLGKILNVVVSVSFYFFLNLYCIKKIYFTKLLLIFTLISIYNSIRV